MVPPSNSSYWLIHCCCGQRAQTHTITRITHLQSMSGTCLISWTKFSSWHKCGYLHFLYCVGQDEADPWERGEAGGASSNECRLRATLVSSDNSQGRERTRPGLYVTVCFGYVCVAVAREGLPILLSFFLFLFWYIRVC